MSYADKTCEVCGYTNYFAGVASASAPISIAWCHVCLAMGAEPMCVILTLNDDPKQVTHLAHFNCEEDRYYAGPDPLPIKLKDGREFERRGDLPDPEEAAA